VSCVLTINSISCTATSQSDYHCAPANSDANSPDIRPHCRFRLQAAHLGVTWTAPGDSASPAMRLMVTQSVPDGDDPYTAHVLSPPIVDDVYCHSYGSAAAEAPASVQSGPSAHRIPEPPDDPQVTLTNPELRHFLWTKLTGTSTSISAAPPESSVTIVGNSAGTDTYNVHVVNAAGCDTDAQGSVTVNRLCYRAKRHHCLWWRMTMARIRTPFMRIRVEVQPHITTFGRPPKETWKPSHDRGRSLLRSRNGCQRM